ncbi:UNVERIFIED_CONTAM: Molybdopterin synthase sulfur carrier subunit [Sesamum latifolium]|uniref:Molybdopterin synthase sulfur carrier subunit n=1 Tax=Sesamum latifolium TaxID=2727402 RepID=A0AAW2XDE6_9LAMI
MYTEEHSNTPGKMDNRKEEKEDISVQIKVLFFARARDLTGMTDTMLEVSPGTTAYDCLNKLITKFPGLEEIRNCMVLALNEEYTPNPLLLKIEMNWLSYLL